MRLLSALFIFFLLSAATLSANARELNFSRNARTLESHHSSLLEKGLAHACLSLTELPDGLPCHPAMTPFVKKPSLGAEILLSTGSSSRQDIQELLADNLDEKTINSLFGKNQTLQVEANADINFKSRYLNGRYSPIEVKAYSVVRNEANPEISIFAVEEKSFLFQSGMQVYGGLYAGLQARLVDRKFIRQDFFLFELATSEGAEILKPRKQSATYLEPGLAYFFEGRWKPRVSWLLANAGFVSEKYEEFENPVNSQFSFGISPPVRWGNLDLSLDYRELGVEETSGLDALHAGALYRYGSMSLVAGLDALGASGGVFYAISALNAGILYTTTQVASGDSNFYTQTVYAQIGWQL